MWRPAAFRAPIAVVVCSLAAAPACRRAAPAPEPAPETRVVPVGAVAAVTAGIRAVVRASGVIVPAEGGEFLVLAPEPARILEIAKMEGDVAESGELLVRFDLPAAAQEVARLTAERAAAQALLENARINQSRVRDFVERGLVPRRDLDAATRDLAEAQASIERLDRALAAAQAAVGRGLVRAPFAGVVAARHHQPGDVVLATSADPVLRIVDPRRLEILATVSDADAARVAPGATARVPLSPSGEPIPLIVAAAPEPAGPGGSRRVRLRFEEPVPLPVDSRVEIEIDAEERADTVLVPAEAVLQNGGVTVVMVAAGAVAERRVVTAGITDDARIEIASGLRAGELVITRGHIGLADGTAISVAREN